MTTEQGPEFEELLLRRQILTPNQIERARREQQQNLLPLASNIFRLGLAEERILVEALAEHFGVPGIELSKCVIDTDVLAMVPVAVARAHQVLPLAKEDGAFKVVGANVCRTDVLDELAFATGCTAVAFTSIRTCIKSVIEAAYTARANGEKLWRGAQATETKPHLEIVQPVSSRPAPSMDFDVPSGAFPAIGADALPLPRRADGKARVLAVDDEDEILLLIEHALSASDIEVLTASRGGEVIDILEAEAPDLILLDAMLPEIHGFELCGQIKRSPRYQHTPVMIISAMASGWNFAQDVQRLYGADGFMAKPFSVVELVRWVEETMERIRNRPRSQASAHASRISKIECKRAAQLLHSGQLDEALATAERAVEANPFDARAHFVLGTVFNAKGETYKAISRYERVAELAPSLFHALKNLAVLYERLGFKAKAVEMWTRALEQSPNDRVRKTIKAHLFALL